MDNDLQPTVTHSPIYKLWRSNIEQQRILCRRLAKLDLTYGEYVVMSLLVQDMPHMRGNRKLALRQQDLAKLLGLNRKIIAQAARSLNRKGLVWRCEDMFDTRSFMIKPTAKGKHVFSVAHQIICQLDKTA